MKKNYFILFGLIIILLKPWFWEYTRKIIVFGTYNYVLTAITALIVIFLYKKLNGKIWQLLFCVIILIPIATELMFYGSFLIHYTNNDVHSDAWGNHPKEMYRDFNSFFDFSYGKGNWRYRLFNILKDISIWIVTLVGFLGVNKLINLN